jgi:S-adenosylmethionine synthetase
MFLAAEEINMAANLNIMLSESAVPHAQLQTEICEHKGIGHPDSICDGAAEAVSRALSAAYLQSYGEIRHHNVDKALLIGGQSKPRFGGGEITAKMRLIIAGRAVPLPGMTDLSDVVCSAARQYLATTLHSSADLFNIESAVRTAGPNFQRVMPTGDRVPLANDTSFGVGFAPYSKLERSVLNVAALLKSTLFRQEFPMAGDDFKVMGVRFNDHISLTLALAIRDPFIENCEHYFSVKERMAKWLHGRTDIPVVIRINALDDPASEDESGIYLTVSGLSAEHGDDGQVGRGNRISRLITPSRPMSLEATAGKCPVSHVGKIYNIIADRLAHHLVSQVAGIAEVEVQIVSCIGQPIDLPQLVDIKVVPKDNLLNKTSAQQIGEIVGIVHKEFSQFREITHQLVLGKIPLF